MKLCVTEKPSVGRDIAAILGANDRHDGYYEGNGWRVTWTFGHLCCLKEPDDYTPLWKRWSLAALPMIPQRFGIKLIHDQGIERQFHVIESLIKQSDELVNCGDAGQEGELIQRWVYQKAGCNIPVKRLWISSLTDQSIRQGFTQLKPASQFDNLYHAGLCRAIGDWLLGMNATRLYTLKYRQGYSRTVLSVGRVQTPTLALIVNRQREIQNFVPQDYWEIKTLYRDTTFNSTRGRYTSHDEAVAVMQAIKAFPLTVTGIETKKGREAPPRLFDLTSLQVECNRKFGYSADLTLRLIQSLYEKKVTTYPRVDTTYLSDDIYDQVPGIMQSMVPYAPLTQPLLQGGKKLPKSKKVFDNSKVTDHHAIIPTDVDVRKAALTHDEKRVYDLVAKRFIAAFYPDCEFLTTTVSADINGNPFRATGKQVVSAGWRALYPKEKQANNDKDEGDNQVMPQFTQGESGPHEPSLVKKQTQPPKAYTEGTLLRAMETAGKLVDDEELRDAMKENGIGRPSTRAAIIETLLKRHYITKQRKSLVATPAGCQLIDTIKEELLKSAKLTGLWERKLRQIERGQYSASQFIDELKQMVTSIVMNVLRDNSGTTIVTEPQPAPKQPAASGAQDAPKPKKKRAPRVTRYDQVICPVCGQGHMMAGKTAWGCSRWKEGCKAVFPYSQYPQTLTPAQLKRQLAKASKAKPAKQ